MTSPIYRGKHRSLAQQRPREAHLLEAGHKLAARYVLRDRLSPAEPVSFRADDALLNRSVTVTFINLDSDYAELIYGSDRMPGISGLGHPALASLFDVGHEADVQESYIVTDYIEGSPLSELIEQQPAGQDLQSLSAHIAELLTGLVSYLKAHGLEHRDLSPANIRVALPSQDAASESESEAVPKSGSVPAEHPLIRSRPDRPAFERGLGHHRGMNAVVMHAVVSVDGFIADANDDVGPLFEWYFNGEAEIVDGGPFKVVRSLARLRAPDVGADRGDGHGRHLFDLTNGWEGAAAGWRAHRGRDAPAEAGGLAPRGRPASSSTTWAAAIAVAKELAGDRDVAVAAGDVGGQALALGLVDEVAMDVVPGGVRPRQALLRVGRRAATAGGSRRGHPGSPGAASAVPGSPLMAVLAR